MTSSKPWAAASKMSTSTCASSYYQTNLHKSKNLSGEHLSSSICVNYFVDLLKLCSIRIDFTYTYAYNTYSAEEAGLEGI